MRSLASCIRFQKLAPVGHFGYSSKDILKCLNTGRQSVNADLKLQENADEIL